MPACACGRAVRRSGMLALLRRRHRRRGVCECVWVLGDRHAGSGDCSDKGGKAASTHTGPHHNNTPSVQLTRAPQDESETQLTTTLRSPNPPPSAVPPNPAQPHPTCTVTLTHTIRSPPNTQEPPKPDATHPHEESWPPSRGRLATAAGRAPGGPGASPQARSHGCAPEHRCTCGKREATGAQVEVISYNRTTTAVPLSCFKFNDNSSSCRSSSQSQADARSASRRHMHQ